MSKKISIQLVQLNKKYGDQVYLPYSAGVLKSFVIQKKHNAASRLGFVVPKKFSAASRRGFVISRILSKGRPGDFMTVMLSPRYYVVRPLGRRGEGS